MQTARLGGERLVGATLAVICLAGVLVFAGRAWLNPVRYEVGYADWSAGTATIRYQSGHGIVTRTVSMPWQSSKINMYGKRPFLTATSEPNDDADLQCLIYDYPLVSQVTFAAATGIRTCSVDR